MKIDALCRIVEAHHPAEGYVQLVLTPIDAELPEMQPGQFVNVLCPQAGGVLLRRPISVNMYDRAASTFTLLIKDAGRGTHALAEMREGDTLRVMLPLGNTFGIDAAPVGKRYLLVGGGVGVAPLLFLGKELSIAGGDVTFLVGARKASDLLQIDEMARYGRVCISTEDGSMGEKGLVTLNTALQENYDKIYSCGPMPMMKAVGKISKERGIPCRVSLENRMACGVGACLCCVEDTTEGHRCTCTDGPVFDIEKLLW